MPNRLTHARVLRQPALWSILCFFALPSPVAAHSAECGWSPTSLPNAQFGPISDPPPLALVSPMPEGVTLKDAHNLLKAAADTWNSSRCGPEIAILDPVTMESLPVGVAPVRFVSDDPCLPEGYLGFTVYSCLDYPFGTILLNQKDFVWSTTPRPFDPLDPSGRLRVDLQAVFTHELGHVLGLSHTPDPLATMAPRYLTDGGQATLAASDILGLCQLNALERRDCERDQDCQYLQCVFGESNSVCEEERGVTGDYCGAELQICPDVCLITSDATLSGYCTIPCGTCPHDMECVDESCQFVASASPSGCATTTPLPLHLFWVMLFAFRHRRVKSQQATG